MIQTPSNMAIDLFFAGFLKAKFLPNWPKISQILFLDTPDNFSNLILKKKFSVKNGFFWSKLEFFRKKYSKIGLKWVKKWRAQGQHHFIFFKILSGFQKCPSFLCRPGGTTRKSRFCEARWSRKSKY